MGQVRVPSKEFMTNLFCVEKAHSVPVACQAVDVGNMAFILYSLKLIFLCSLVIVSTLDGRLTAFSTENGIKAWDLETQPLLSSNLHHVEVI